MASPEDFKHIKIDSFVSSRNYRVSSNPMAGKLIDRDRTVHGGRLLGQIQQIKSDYEAAKLEVNQLDLLNDEVIYLDFYSPFNFQPFFDGFQSEADKLKYKLLNITKEKRLVENETEIRYKVTLVLSKGGIEEFIKKIQAYLTTNTKDKKDKEGNVIKSTTPSNQKLLNNIEEIKKATLKSFWSESSDVIFPEPEETVWWEVWFRRKKGAENDQTRRIEEQLKAVGAETNTQQLLFPEHIIRLVKASADQLSKSLMLLDSLAELRKPQETAEFFTNLDNTDKAEWLNDLVSRVDNLSDINSVAICLLDTGVNNQHPLLIDFLPQGNMHTWKEDWGTDDSHSAGGHGTGMAGLSLYGDITHVLASPMRIQIYHQLESVKIFHERDPNDPKLYGTITIDACSKPVIDYPERPRVFCMAITAPPFTGKDDNEYWGRPSSWSSSIDKIAFGDNDNKELFFISGGNIDPQQKDDYDVLNETSSIHDPGQAFNAITVGGYTDMDQIDAVKYPAYNILASKGNLSPSSSTSLFWQSKWPIKPDIVLEAGNYAYSALGAGKLDSLQLLAPHKDFNRTPFQSFGDTSGAAALAAKLAAELKSEYSTLWPETIRGLMLHSAKWNAVMMKGKTLVEMNTDEKRVLLRKFGYGIPNLERARYSAKNSVTLIAENHITPFQKTTSVQYNEFHLYELPWPKDVLQNEVFTEDAILNVTLSYFIEPNPGNRLYANSFSYQSHGLGFRVIGKDEKPEVFLKRISIDTREKDEDGKLEKEFPAEPWFIGPRTREKGSVQKDFITMSGADMSTRNIIAVFPKAGWYKTRAKEAKYGLPLRYSLIISIETPNVEIDLYNSVYNLIPNPIPL